MLLNSIAFKKYNMTLQKIVWLFFFCNNFGRKKKKKDYTDPVPQKDFKTKQAE